MVAQAGKEEGCANLQVGEAPALVQLGEVASELHSVRLIDPGGGLALRLCRGRLRWVSFLARTLPRSHWQFETDFLRKKESLTHQVV